MKNSNITNEVSLIHEQHRFIGLKSFFLFYQFLEKRVSMELIAMTLFCTLELAYEKTLRMKLLCNKIKSHRCLEIYQSANDTITTY